MISELRTFVYKSGRPDHMEGYHDDIIMAYAMCIFVIQTSFKKLKLLENQTKAMLDSWVNVSSSSVNTQPTYTNPFYTNTPHIIHNKPTIMVTQMMVENITGYLVFNI